MSGIKFNIDKFKFAVLKVESFRYNFTWTGIKLDPKHSKQLSILNDQRIKTGKAVPMYSTIISWLMAKVKWDISTAHGID